MNVSGVITEYNPFHNGHKYQLEEIKKRTNADYIIVAMSGDFVQRGEPAIMDKYTRCAFTLENGADLVLEIPVVYTCSSAEHFARGGVNLLASTGVVTNLCFGVETDIIDALSSIARLLIEEPPVYKETLTGLLSKGYSYPKARCMAISDYFSEADDIMSDIINQPNNILGIEYIKNIIKYHNNITPIPIKRQGQGYHSKTIDSPLASASAIRKYLYNDSAKNKDMLSTFLPDNTLNKLMEYENKYGFIYANEISGLLHYKLLLNKKEGFTDFLDCNEELSNKIKNNIINYKNFSQFCELLKSKNYTYSRISRVLLHILLEIKDSNVNYPEFLDNAPYLRVLGFKKDSSALLSQIKKEATAPLISKMADASNHLNESGKILIDKDIFAADIYNLLINSHNKDTIKNDFSHKIVII